MGWKLFLLFTVVPAIELYLIALMGKYVGPMWTVLSLLAAGALGAWLAKREGLSVLRSLEEESRTGFPSGDRVVEGVLVLLGAVLLITPGQLTDLVGLLCIFPPSRRFLAPRVKAWLLKKALGGGFKVNFGAGAAPPPPPAAEPQPRGHFEHPVSE